MSVDASVQLSECRHHAVVSRWLGRHAPALRDELIGATEMRTVVQRLLAAIHAAADDAVLAGAMAACLVAFGRDADASRWVERSLRQDPNSEDSWLLAASIDARLATPDAERQRLDAAVVHCPNSGVLHLRLSEALERCGEPGLALAALRRASELTPSNIGLCLRLARRLRESGDAVAARHCVDSAMALEPASPTVLQASAETDLALGHAAAALATLDRISALGVVDVPLRHLYVQGLTALQDDAALLEAWLDAGGGGAGKGDDLARVALEDLIRTAPDGSPLQQAWMQRRIRWYARRSPGDLAAALERLSEADPAADAATAQLLDWIEQRLPEPPADVVVWRARARWGQRAGELIRDAWRGDVAQLEALTRLVDARALQSIAASQRGGLVVTAHLSGLWAVVEAKLNTLPGFRLLAAAPPSPRQARDARAGSVVISTRRGPLALREVVATLKSGGWIGLAVDAPRAADTIAVPFFGASIRLSRMPARLVVRHGRPSWFTVPIWRADGRLEIAALPLPSPLPAESEDHFAKRWCMACAAALEPLLAGDPANLGLNNGLWQSLREGMSATGAADGG